MLTLILGALATLGLLLAFYISDGVFKAETKFEVTYTTFPHYIRAYELLIALNTGALVLLMSQIEKFIEMKMARLPVVSAAWAFITSIALSILFILLFIRAVQVSEPYIDKGSPQPTGGTMSRLQHCTNMFLAISAVTSFLLGFVYLAQALYEALSSSP
jgi:hypothetical protein